MRTGTGSVKNPASSRGGLHGSTFSAYGPKVYAGGSHTVTTSVHSSIRRTAYKAGRRNPVEVGLYFQQNLKTGKSLGRGQAIITRRGAPAPSRTAKTAILRHNKQYLMARGLGSQSARAVRKGAARNLKASGYKFKVKSGSHVYTPVRSRHKRTQYTRGFHGRFA